MRTAKSTRVFHIEIHTITDLPKTVRFELQHIYIGAQYIFRVTKVAFRWPARGLWQWP